MRFLARHRMHFHFVDTCFAQEPAAPAIRAIDPIIPVAACWPGRSGLRPARIGRGFRKAWPHGQTDSRRDGKEDCRHQQYLRSQHESPIAALIPIHAIDVSILAAVSRHYDDPEKSCRNRTLLPLAPWGAISDYRTTYRSLT